MKNNKRIATRRDYLDPLEPASPGMLRRAIAAKRLQGTEERRENVYVELQKIEEQIKALERDTLPSARQALERAEAELDAARRARYAALEQYNKLRHRATALKNSAKNLTSRLTQMDEGIKALRKGLR
jgi:predicted  nucleic acid-binding Zn-ribbon protein